MSQREAKKAADDLEYSEKYADSAANRLSKIKDNSRADRAKKAAQRARELKEEIRKILSPKEG